MSNAGQGPTAAKSILLFELAIPALQRQGWDGSVGKPSLMVSDAFDEESPIKLS